MTHQDDFKEKLDLALRVHDAARGALPPGSPEGHFVNENTLVRIDEELEAIRDRLGANWLEQQGIADVPGFDSYITMRVYRNSVVHHRGTPNEEFHGGKCTHGGMGCKTSGRRSKYRANYEHFCSAVGVLPLQPGEKLLLAVREPDFLMKLIEGVREFAEQVPA
jgi:hypothetical protein